MDTAVDHPVTKESHDDPDQTAENDVVPMMVIAEHEGAREVGGKQDGEKDEPHFPIRRATSEREDTEVGEKVNGEIAQAGKSDVGVARGKRFDSVGDLVGVASTHLTDGEHDILEPDPDRLVVSRDNGLADREEMRAESTDSLFENDLEERARGERVDQAEDPMGEIEK